MLVYTACLALTLDTVDGWADDVGMWLNTAKTAAVGIARARVKRTAAQELWWVHHRHEWLRDGGDDARRPPTTSATWAAKWSGLFRLRRDRDCPGRFEERPGGPMSAAWYRDV